MIRGMLAVAYVVYLAAVAYLVWEPDASTPGGVVAALADVLERLGLPGGVDAVETGLNVVLFVPLSLLGAFLVGRWRVVWWGAVGLATTVLIEGVQWSLLPTRTPSLRDVLANTAGAVVGVAAALLLRRVLPERWTEKMTP